MGRPSNFWQGGREFAYYEDDRIGYYAVEHGPDGNGRKEVRSVVTAAPRSYWGRCDTHNYLHTWDFNSCSEFKPFASAVKSTIKSSADLQRDNTILGNELDEVKKDRDHLWKRVTSLRESLDSERSVLQHKLDAEETRHTKYRAEIVDAKNAVIRDLQARLTCLQGEVRGTGEGSIRREMREKDRLIARLKEALSRREDQLSTAQARVAAHSEEMALVLGRAEKAESQVRDTVCDTVVSGYVAPEAKKTTNYTIDYGAIQNRINGLGKGDEPLLKAIKPVGLMCGELSPRGKESWVCTLPKDHPSNEHVARDSWGLILCSWPRE